jgi:serpin B
MVHLKRSHSSIRFRSLALFSAAVFTGLTSTGPALSASSPAGKPAKKNPSKSVKAQKVRPTKTEVPAKNSTTTPALSSQLPLAKTLSPSVAFSLRLYRTLAKGAKPTENVIMSPYSVAEALSMVRGGASGNTAKELDNVLNNGSAVEPANRKNRRQDLLRESVGGSGTYVRVGNSLWVNNGYPIVPSFAELVKTAYAAKADLLDLGSDPEGSAKKINAWISETTEKQIEQLVSPQDFNELSRAVLVNAVLFHGKWFRPFDRSLTAPEPFAVSGQSIAVPTMHGIADVTPGKIKSTINIIYTSSYRMRIVVPADPSAGSVDSAIDSLFAEPVQLGQGEQCEKIKIRLPKWKSETKFDLIDPLKELGIQDLFNEGRADLSGISPQAKADRLYIAKAIHKANVTVDEEGTVAAAATALFAEAASAPMRPETCPTEFKINRPFAYVIQHYETGEILFAGRVLNPLSVDKSN